MSKVEALRERDQAVAVLHAAQVGRAVAEARVATLEAALRDLDAAAEGFANEVVGMETALALGLAINRARAALAAPKEAQ